ncbi:MAG: hypothetical protein V5A63_06765 [Bacteroides sp.]|jgi:hypothetical protein|uniref:hypothetical protein n=1 Tax=Bacteroides sp. TaxID=29523 RepID=UPI002FC3AADD
MRKNNTKRRTVLFPSFLILQKESYGRERIGIPEAVALYGRKPERGMVSCGFVYRYHHFQVAAKADTLGEA